MPTTPNLSLPFPSLSQPPNVPADMEALAETIDAIRPMMGLGTPAAVTIDGTLKTCNTLTMTGLPPGQHIVVMTGTLLPAMATGVNSMECTLRADSTVVGFERVSIEASRWASFSPSGIHTYTHSGTMTFTMTIQRTGGSSASNTYDDPRFNRLSVLAFPYDI